MGGIVCGQLKGPQEVGRKHKELIMKNQTSGNRGGSSKFQAMKDPASKTVSGKGPAADTSKGKSTGAAIAANQSSAPGPMAPDSVKGGHL
jgi:hypothetical protein